MKYLKVSQPGNFMEKSWYLKIMKEESHGFFLLHGQVQEKSWNFSFDYESVKLCCVLQIIAIARLRYINFRAGFAKSVSNKKQYFASPG